MCAVSYLKQPFFPSVFSHGVVSCDQQPALTLQQGNVPAPCSRHPCTDSLPFQFVMCGIAIILKLTNVFCNSCYVCICGVLPLPISDVVRTIQKLKTWTENDVKKSRFIAKMSHKSKPHLVDVLSWERISKCFWNANLVLKFWPTVVSLLRVVVYICEHMKTCWEGFVYFVHRACIFLIKSLKFCWSLGQYSIPIYKYVH